MLDEIIEAIIFFKLVHIAAVYFAEPLDCRTVMKQKYQMAGCANGVKYKNKGKYRHI